MAQKCRFLAHIHRADHAAVGGDVRVRRRGVAVLNSYGLAGAIEQLRVVAHIVATPAVVDLYLYYVYTAAGHCVIA